MNKESINRIKVDESQIHRAEKRIFTVGVYDMLHIGHVNDSINPKFNLLCIISNGIPFVGSGISFAT